MLEILARFMRRSITMASCLALYAFMAAPVQAAAETPVTVVVPFPAGSATDSLGRMLAVELEEKLGRPVVIQNRPGASGVIGAMSVKTAPADGNTILLTTNTTQAANASLFKSLPYDPVKDFTAIGQLGSSGMMLMIQPDPAVQDVNSLVENLRRKDTGVTYGHGSAAGQVAAALFVEKLGLNAVPIPYKGIPLAVVDLVGGRLDFVFVDISSASGHMEAGRLKGLAVALPERTPREPNIPTLTELGITGVEVQGWFGLMAPAGTPQEAVRPLSEALAAAVADSDFQLKMLGIGIAPAYKNSSAFTQMIEVEVEKWRGFVETAGIEPM